jgi:AcrR family transcriptional regulator
MSENFLKIAEEEQDRILNVVLEEFAQKGYQRASTNAIIEKAGIPKGTLFYFFGSKKNMFFFALDQSIQRYITIYKSLVFQKHDDLFVGLLQRMRIKLQFIQQEPLLYKFFYRVFLDIPDELKDEMSTRFATYTATSQEQARENIDPSKLRKGVDPSTAVNLVHLMLEGLFNRLTPRLKQISPEEGIKLVGEIEQECRGYFELIKNGIYK